MKLLKQCKIGSGDGARAVSPGLIAGIASGCGVLVLGLIGLGIYAIRQKRIAERAIGLSKPFGNSLLVPLWQLLEWTFQLLYLMMDIFRHLLWLLIILTFCCSASWAPSGKDSGGAPQLKGARWFSYDELKKSTKNFSETYEIGSGGYGKVFCLVIRCIQVLWGWNWFFSVLLFVLLINKVYRGILPNGQVVAIKRAQQGSMQGGVEFKTEIELLSRVHHKNLVGLVGFCFEQGEQMLVYEFMPNGTLRESLLGAFTFPPNCR